MQSIRSRFFIFLLKHRHWFRFKLKGDIVDWNTDIQQMRARIERSSGMFGKLPPDIEIEDTGLNHPRAEFVKISGTKTNRVLLYFHGGGYVMGSAKAHRTIVSKFVRGSGVNALTFDYRLAPEHPFPAALDDAVSAYRWLLDQAIEPAQIVFIGDSAGAGLCLASLLAIRDKGLPLPAAAVAMSPWTDLNCTGTSYKQKDPLAPEGSWEVYGAYYAGITDKAHPMVSPLYGDLSGLPPLFISVGENENMLDDSVRFAEKAQKAGVDVSLHIGKGMVHCYPALSPMFPEAKNAMQDICEFINAQMAVS